jgi:pyruvate dehydrogenase E2 component (dihydrolipoamide acetyltransferase)
MAEFRMPWLGADMEDGTLLQWLVKPGQLVQRGDIVACVETDKADVEIEIFDSGVIEQLLVEEGEKVPAGTVLATLASAGAGEAPAFAALQAAPPPPSPAPPLPSPPPAVRTTGRATPVARKLAAERHVDLDRLKGSGPGGRITRHDVELAERKPAVRASPRARKLARDRGVDLAAIAGTGPGGAITASDVEALDVTPLPIAPPSAPSPRPAAAPPDKLAARRRAIAAAMERSNRDIPHYYLGLTIDLSAPLEWLEHANLNRPVTERILYSAMLVRAVGLACRQVPEVNGHWIEGEFHGADAVNVGVAISLREGGLVAPAIHDVDRLDLGHVMAALRDLVNRARAGSLRSSELADPTITVTNLGEQGVETVYPVIFPPQVAIVGFGRIVERPWAVNGLLGVRPTIFCSLAADHRASDGHRGGRFLAAVEQFLLEPDKL